MRNINRVCVSGNLTRDPELKEMSGDNKLCKLRIAVNERVKDSTGEWGERANFFDVDVWGAQATSCDQYLSKGRAVMIDGRLRWREWEDDNGNKRQAISIIADNVQFLPDGKKREGGGSSAEADYYAGGAASSGQDDDIPF